MNKMSSFIHISSKSSMLSCTPMQRGVLKSTLMLSGFQCSLIPPK